MDYRILHDNGFDVEFGLDCTGSDDNYLHLLQRYYRNLDKTEDALSNLLVDRDIEGYTRTVHSLKSSSKMIGAMEFAAMAEEMEMLGKRGDYNALLIKTPALLDAYEAVVKIIEPYGEMPEVHPEGEIDGITARTTAKELLATLDDCDDSKALELVEKLKNYPFRITQKSMLKDAALYIADFEYEAAYELISKILPEIED